MSRPRQRPRQRAAGVAGRATLTDVATLAGVSAQTVSRVVRQSPDVAEATRAKVMHALETLDYRPNLAARSLSAQRIGSVHVVVAVELFHGTTQAFIAICQALAAQGFATSTTIATPRCSGELEMGDRGSQAVIPVTADGVIVLGGTTAIDPWLGGVAQRVPVVYMGRTEGLPEGVSGVMVDQFAGARMATEHLIARGCRHLAHVAGPMDWLDAELRRDGFLAAATQAGIEHQIIHSPTWDAADSVTLAADLDTDVDGVFAANDHLALGVLKHSYVEGWRVPDDLKVVGVDDVTGADAYSPALTTVRQGFPAMGRIAVEKLTGMMNGEPPSTTLLQPELIVRESA